VFELSVALKYLVPRRRQLSVSIISLISILVIALVVLLIVVFFSVTHGLEKSWTQKLIALTAPVRIMPTEAYYRSYYYQIDSHSMASGYAPKSILEKLRSPSVDPFDPDYDGELPRIMPKADRNPDGSLKDLANQAFQITVNLKNVPGLRVRDFEMTASNLKLHLVRGSGKDFRETYLSQMSYIGAVDPDNRALENAILPLTVADISNLWRLLALKEAEMDFGIYAVHSYAISKNSRSFEPPSIKMGDGLLLPKTFRNSHVLVGDQGQLTYYVPTLSGTQEQQLPVYVAGFYDPGVIPLGGKYLLASHHVVSLLRALPDESLSSNGINVFFTDLEQAEQLKAQIEKAFEQAGINQYWHVETYREYEFTRDLLQQLRSERNLWTLLATVIIIVACSNIISMLIILVNDKKREIGILRAMGATSLSIASIFGICGMIMGTLGSILGMLAATYTLKNLQSLVDFIGKVQGHQMFNPLFYGDALPNEISFEALVFVIMTTAAVSILAGVVPAVKASLLKPASILRAE
jgi:ABC-type lipoprotein release transport system permease subunit